MTTKDVALYYDELHLWTNRDSGFRVFSGFENDTIHCFMIDTNTGNFSPTTIYKFIDPHLPPHGTVRGLDAGCGYGGTCFHSLRARGGHWTGVTISPEQWNRANALAKERGLEGSAEFHLRSYDEPLPGRYNVIIAIESLIHSPDPNFTLRNLVSSLDAGGRLIIIDDLPLEQISEEDAALLADLKRAWRCPVALTAKGWKDLAQSCGLRLIDEQDFTHLLKPRPEADLDAGIAQSSSQHAEKVQLGFGRLTDAEIGGMHLERLLQRRSVRYMMLVFEK